MNGIKTLLIKGIFTLCSVYFLICLVMFIMQENLIFFPDKLPQDYSFQFYIPFEEMWVDTEDAVRLHGLLFKADSSRGVIFYLHGNAGAVDSWGWVAGTYTTLGYDIFILDYRGYGKSEGHINNENQFYNDVEKAYKKLIERYDEKDIVILGYSIGSAAATKSASENHPKRLILNAPYYSILDLKDIIYPFIPDFLVNYKFETFRFLEQVKVPVTIFHGDRDEVIYYGSSLKLKKHLKKQDRLITLHNQSHNGIEDNPQYMKELAKLLNEE